MLTGPGDGSCAACPETTYKNGLGDGVCQDMPLAQQERLVANYLIFQSRTRPFCIPGTPP